MTCTDTYCCCGNCCPSYGAVTYASPEYLREHPDVIVSSPPGARPKEI